MTNEWFFQSNGRRFGPISAGLMKQQVEAGRILPETRVRKGEAGKWMPAAKVRGLFEGDGADELPEPAIPPLPPVPLDAPLPDPPGSASDSGTVDAIIPAGDVFPRSTSLLRQVSDVPQIVSSAGVILLVLIGMVALWLLTAEIRLDRSRWHAATQEHPQWEYTIESPGDLLIESELERLGTEGWELVFARHATSSLTDEVAYEMIFKRRRLPLGDE